MQAVPIPLVRRLLMARAYLEKFGYTAGRTKCVAIQTGDESQPCLSHNEACRARIKKLLGIDPLLKKRLERERARQDDNLARRDEAEDLAGKRVRVSGAASGAGEETQPGPTIPTDVKL